MKYCVNATKAVINISGHTVIAPTRGAWVDPEIRGVQDLIDRELLVESEAPEGAQAPNKDAEAGQAVAVEAKEPSTVKELKAWLDKQGAQYSPSAAKPELHGLYEALKTTAPAQGGDGTPGGNGSQES